MPRIAAPRSRSHAAMPWSTWVWTRFLYHKFLTPLAGQGTWAGWEVRWDEALLRQEIREALAGHTLQVA